MLSVLLFVYDRLRLEPTLQRQLSKLDKVTAEVCNSDIVSSDNVKNLLS